VVPELIGKDSRSAFHPQFGHDPCLLNTARGSQVPWLPTTYVSSSSETVIFFIVSQSLSYLAFLLDSAVGCHSRTNGKTMFPDIFKALTDEWERQEPVRTKGALY